MQLLTLNNLDDLYYVAELCAMDGRGRSRHRNYGFSPLTKPTTLSTGLENPAAALLDKGRVAVNDGATFGPDGKGFVRLNFATSTDILDEALTRMAAVLE